MERATIYGDTFVRPSARPSAGVRATLIAGTVEHGDHRGRELGFPTANLPVGEGIAGDGTRNAVGQS